MSRDGLLPRWLSHTTEHQRDAGPPADRSAAPWWPWSPGLTNVDLLEEMINIGTLSAFVLVSIGILVLRKKRPDLQAAPSACRSARCCRSSRRCCAST